MSRSAPFRTRTLFSAFVIAGSLALPPASVEAAERTWTGGDGFPFNWNSPANWGGQTLSSADTVVFTGDSGLENVNNIATVGFRLQAITFDGNADAFSLSGLGFQLGATAAAGTGTITTESTHLQTIGNTITLTRNAVFTVGSGGLKVTGAMDDSTTARSLTVTGGGTLHLSGASTYRAGTLLNQATLLVDLSDRDNVLLNTGNVTFESPSTLQIKGRNTGLSSQGIDSLYLSTSSAKATAGYIEVDGGAGAGTTLAVGTIANLGISTLHLTLNGNAAFTANGLTTTNDILSFATVKDSGGTGFATLDGTSLVRYTGVTPLPTGNPLAEGNYSLDGSHTFSETGTKVLHSLQITSTNDADALNIGSDYLRATGGILVSGDHDYTITGASSAAKLELHSTTTYLHVMDGGELNLAVGLQRGQASNTPLSLVKSGQGRLRLSAAATGFNARFQSLNIADGTVLLDHANAVANMQIVTETTNALEFATGIGEFSTGYLMGRGSINLEDLNGEAITLITTGGINSETTSAVSLSGSGTWVYNGTTDSLMRLDGTYSHTGGTVVNSGRILVNNARQLPGHLTVNGGGVLFYGVAVSQHIASLSGTGGHITGRSNGATTLTIDSNVVSAYRGDIRNNNSHAFHLIKSGTGTQVLDGTSTFFGTTRVAEGKLTINGALSSASNAVTVEDGATLAGLGNIAGTVLIQQGATLAAGNADEIVDRLTYAPIGTLSVGATTLEAGATLAFDLASDGTGAAGTQWDQIAITGALTLTGVDLENPIFITLSTLGGDLRPGALTAWDGNVDHIWHSVVTTTSGFSIPLDPQLFAFDTSHFVNPFAGQFSLIQNGNNLDLHFTAEAIPEPSTYGLLFGSAMALFASQWLRRRRMATAA